MSILASMLLSAVSPEKIDCLANNESPTGETDRLAFYATPEKIDTAALSFHEYSSEPVLNLTLSEAGNAEFLKLQEGRIGRSLALCIGNQLLVEPRLNEPILAGSMQITGNFTIEELNDIVNKLQPMVSEP